jgi:hypothetical protein
MKNDNRESDRNAIFEFDLCFPYSALFWSGKVGKVCQVPKTVGQSAAKFFDPLGKVGKV